MAKLPVVVMTEQISWRLASVEGIIRKVLARSGGSDKSTDDTLKQIGEQLGISPNMQERRDTGKDMQGVWRFGACRVMVMPEMGKWLR